MVFAVMSTLMVQLLLAARSTPEVRLTPVTPAAMLGVKSVAATPQVPPRLGVAAISTPAGKLSVKFNPVKLIGFGLVIVKVRVDKLFTSMMLGEKALSIMGSVISMLIDNPPCVDAYTVDPLA